MATMIPRLIDESTRSSGERRLFERLASDPDTEGWIVLHSLGLSRTASKPFGEIDFVVLVPGGGIACLEVKAGRVACHEGIWSVTDREDRPHQMKRSPFMQAREGMFALRNHLLSRLGADHPVAHTPIAAAVVFTDTDAPPETPEFEPWEAIDRKDFHRPIATSVRRLLQERGRRLGKMVDGVAFSAAAVQDVRRCLRPDFELVETRSARIGRTEQQVLRLSVEQYEVLDRLSENERCLLKGAAGTGKTVLSVEYARRAAQEGKRVLVVCYNRLFGDWLRGQLGSAGGLTAGSYYRVLRELIVSSALRDEFLAEENPASPERLFNEIYPFYGELVTDEQPSFDVLVVDEGQDLATAPVLNVLDGLLRGGLAGGRWVLAGDFTHQALFGTSSGGVDLIREHAPHFAVERLTINCRNTRQIAEETVLLSGFGSPPFRFGPVDGLSVDYRYWRNEQHQVEVLDRTLRGLLDDGCRPDDVIILSPRAFERSSASQVDGEGAYAVRVISDTAIRTKRREIGFSTIQAYKGLESPIVLMVDVDTLEDEEPQALIYVGMSRARSHLTVLLHDRTRPALSRLVARKLQETWTR